MMIRASLILQSDDLVSDTENSEKNLISVLGLLGDILYPFRYSNENTEV